MIVVLFKTQMRKGVNVAEYQQDVTRMRELASQVPGFISVKPFSSPDGDSVTIVKFESEEALNTWRTHPEHVQIQRKGREVYYEYYWIQVCQSIREYEWTRQAQTAAS